MSFEKTKSHNGITLIALIITIIVLLILAGVSIATLAGDNGLLTKAQEASKKNEQASEEELRRLTALEAATNVENFEFKDSKENKAIIPAGFAVSQVEGENVIDDGLVIIDQNGNEFVWIPVDLDELANKTEGTDNNGNTNYQGKLYEFTSNGSNEIEEYGQETSSNREPVVVLGTNNALCDENPDYLDIITKTLKEYINDYADINIFEKTMQEDYNKMAKSVEKYHGFYVSRYEMSKSSDGSRAASIGNTMPLVNDTDNMWYGLYAYGKTYKTNSVESSMIWGCQYDAMLRWMQSGEHKVDVTATSEENRNKTEMTGSSNTDIIKNIYDIYGCHYEWTLEANYARNRVTRGRK